MNDVITTGVSRTLQNPALEYSLGASVTDQELEALDDLVYSQRVRAKSYIEAFRKWMKVWSPQFFATFNLPNRRGSKQQIRDHSFYLGLWTRCAETDLTGLKHPSRSRRSPRFVWIFRKEIKHGLTHYHAVVKAPPIHFQSGVFSDNPFRNSFKLELALKKASSRTPECFRKPTQYLPATANIDVEPFATRHASYLLKEMTRRFSWDFETNVDETLTLDSGLLILPNART